jgi:hypothetical protein
MKIDYQITNRTRMVYLPSPSSSQLENLVTSKNILASVDLAAGLKIPRVPVVALLRISRYPTCAATYKMNVTIPAREGARGTSVDEESRGEVMIDEENLEIESSN